MTTAAAIGYGTRFQTADSSSPGVWTDFAEVTNLTPPALKRDSIDASNEQISGGWREFIPGLKDGGEVKFDFNLVPKGTAYLSLMTELGTQTVSLRRIMFPDGSTLTFSAFLTDWEQTAPLDDKMTGTATFKVTGAPTLVQAP